jgi:predicted acetyltransferase
MTNPAKKPLAHIELRPAGVEQEQTLANLLQLYAHDFSEFHDLEIGAEGRFGYTPLPLYWSEPGRYPFLIKMDGKLAGFVLVKRGSEFSGDPTVWDIAEFCVLRVCRRRGIGTHVAHLVWRRFPGWWEVRVMQANVSAQYFWTMPSRYSGAQQSILFTHRRMMRLGYSTDLTPRPQHLRIAGPKHPDLKILPT